MTPTTLAVLTGTACILMLCWPGAWKVPVAALAFVCGLFAATAIMERGRS